MRLPLLYYGHPLLRKRAEPVGVITEEIRQFVKDLLETMDDCKGVGLAAPQVGRLLRIFVLRDYVEGDDGWLKLSDTHWVYINPKITVLGDDLVNDREGCLSIPGLRGHVVRPLKIRVEATDLEGRVFVHELEGYNARSRLHENDHLNGVLYIDRMDPHERKAMEPDLRAIKKKYNPSKSS